MSKYIETRRLTASDLRALCIERDWYTRGNNDEYDHLLTDLASDKPNLSTGDIIAIAEDIAAHSRLEDGEDVPAIAFEVARTCSVTFQRVPCELADAARQAVDERVLPKLMAVLEAAGCTEPEDVAAIAGRLDEYILEPEHRTYKDIALADLHIVVGALALELLLPYVDLDAYGKAVTGNMNLTLTSYGAVSRRDGQPIPAMGKPREDV